MFEQKCLLFGSIWNGNSQGERLYKRNKTIVLNLFAFVSSINKQLFEYFKFLNELWNTIYNRYVMGQNTKYWCVLRESINKKIFRIGVLFENYVKQIKHIFQMRYRCVVRLFIYLYIFFMINNNSEANIQYW